MKRRLTSTALLLAAALTGCGQPIIGSPRIDAGADGGPDAGPACACDDGVACTLDECADDGACVHTPLVERCEDDGAACTATRCDAALGCVHDPDDGACDDALACTADRCTSAGCLHAPDSSACDDGIGCTTDTCAEGAGCLHVPDDGRCAATETCRAATDCTERPRCSGPDDPRCDDGVACTTDRCDAATGRCVYESDDTACEDGLFCNGVSVCVPFEGCLLARATRCDDGVPCTIDQCDEAADRCVAIAEHRLCDDGAFCNGRERCEPTAGGCVPGAVVDCDDADACTVDGCDESRDRCSNRIVDADGDGDGALACGGSDCDDGDPAVSGLAPEACNAADDDCDGAVDEGVLGPCGDCDPTCRRQRTTGSDFGARGRRTGSEIDPARGGLVISTSLSEANYLWVPNTAESTLSRWDATTATEQARYRVGLPGGECPDTCCWANGCNMPSRVVVDGRGDAYVANRGFGMQGTVTKIAASIDDCVDRNLNGMIDTSVDSTPLPWGEDECVLWTANVGPIDALLRAIAIDRGDAAHPEGYPWVGGFNSQAFWKIDPDDGAVLDMATTAPLHPYGAVVLGDGRLWIGTLSDASTGYFDTTVPSPSATAVAYPTARRGGCTQSYGLTADAAGRLWFAGWGCRDAMGLDTRSGQWTRVDTTGYGLTTGRGITVDGRGQIWMALGGDGQSEVVTWSADGFVPGGTIGGVALRRTALPAGHTGPSGVGADRDGNIWVAHHVTSQLVKIDPDTRAMTSYTGPNRVYTYSDFTGSVRRTVIGIGSYSEDVDAGCDAPTWGALDYDVGTPAGTSVELTARTAASGPALAAASDVSIAVSPPDSTPGDVGAALTGAGETHGRWLRLTTTLNGSGGSSPVVRDYTVTWACP